MVGGSEVVVGSEAVVSSLSFLPQSLFCTQRAQSYDAGGLNPGPRQQFIIFNSIINSVQGEEEFHLFVQCSTVYPVMNRISPFRLGSQWC